MIRNLLSFLIPVTALDRKGLVSTVGQHRMQSADCCCYEPGDFPGGCW